MRLRHLVSTFAPVAAAFLATAGALTAQQHHWEPHVRNIVLVHGAWADGSSWAKVIPLLEADGYHVVAVQIPLTSLDDDVAATKRALADLNGPAILVGHSYGGVVITEAGVDPKVAGLVFVSAYAPDAGQSAASLGEGYPESPLSTQLVPDAAGYFTITPKGIFEDFAEDLPFLERLVLLDTQGPLAAKAFKATVSVAAWRSKPSWFVVSAKDRAIPPALERAEAAEMNATTVTVQGGHLSLLAHPGTVARVIEQAAEKSGR
jgi:pimeloyl-ACP methyl ester carboxylesterase